MAASDSILGYLRKLHAKYAPLVEGEVATYIPELGKANPDWFGICLVTAAGAVYEVGDTTQPFTIQSISKPFLYGKALEECGIDGVLAKVGVEPTGDAFNSISLEAGTGRPRNPMINAGAIAVCSLLQGRSERTKLLQLLDAFGRYAGRSLEVDEAVFASESSTGDRNRAIAHMLRSFGYLGENLEAVLELYFRLCSVSVTCRDLGMMAATLANNGVNPLTREQALSPDYVPNVLGVMASCGMYNSAGEWIYRVGLPAKSGVGGGVIAVLPGQLGVGVFSPRLDPHGNSVRGMRLCEELSRELQLHLFSPPNNDASVVRAILSGADFHSTRIALPQEIRLLDKEGGRIKVFQLQGNLTFTSAEVVARTVQSHIREGRFFVLDCRRVTGFNRSACRIFSDMVRACVEAGVGVVLSHVRRLPALTKCIEEHADGLPPALFGIAADNDAALEWCENRLLAESREK
ncbi:MAG TPA: glutaminase A, partial [Candidatus Methylacidiphilales bacterium]